MCFFNNANDEKVDFKLLYDPLPDNTIRRESGIWIRLCITNVCLICSVQ